MTKIMIIPYVEFVLLSRLMSIIIVAAMLLCSMILLKYVGHCYVKCYPEQQKEVVKWIEKIRREVLPENISYQVRTFQDDLYEIQAMEYMLKDTILFFAIVSIIITLLGVCSSITLNTERRQKEVAIRKVNRANVAYYLVVCPFVYNFVDGYRSSILSVQYT